MPAAAVRMTILYICHICWQSGTESNFQWVWIRRVAVAVALAFFFCFLFSRIIQDYHLVADQNRMFHRLKKKRCCFPSTRTNDYYEI